MKTNKDYIMRKVAGEAMLIPTGAAAQKINGMIHLTSTAEFIWQEVDQSQDIQEIINKVMQEFEVDEETAGRDVHGFLYALAQEGMIQDLPEVQEI